MSVYKGQEKVLNSITAVEEEKVKAIANERTVLKNTDLDTVLEEGKYYVWNTCTNSPVDFGHLNVSRYDNQFVLQTIAHYDTSNSKKIFVRTRSNGVWGKWQKVCTTSVADVPKTTLTFPNTTYYTPVSEDLCYYFVKNGICYINLRVKVITSTALDNDCRFTGLPKSTNTINQILTSTTAGAKGLQIYQGGTTLNLRHGEPNAQYEIFYSYPVAES